MDLQLYGIATCDDCRRARKWLSEAGLACRYHDLRADGIEAAVIAGWARAVGWERLVNRRSTTWRTLSGAQRDIDDLDQAVALLAAHPTLIKRPVLIVDGEVTVGFDAGVRERLVAGTDR